MYIPWEELKGGEPAKEKEKDSKEKFEKSETNGQKYEVQSDEANGTSYLIPVYYSEL